MPRSDGRDMDDTALDASQTELWHRWRSNGDLEARECLTSDFLPYARVVAAMSYAKRTHDDIDFDEYLQLACIGLVEAVDRFDPTFGVKFQTYACKRMQGAILSGLERLTEKNQQISVLKRLRKERLESLKDEQDLDASALVRGDSRSIQSRNDLFSCLANVGVALALGVLLEGTGMVNVEVSSEEATHLTPEVSYFRKSELIQLSRLLSDLLLRLSPQEQAVIRYHYLQEIPFDEIATMFVMSKARVSQLHRMGIKKLRELLACKTSCDVLF